MLLILVATVGVLAPAEECLQLEVLPRKSHLLAGETLLVDVRWFAACDTQIDPPIAAAVVIDSGAGFAPFYDVDVEGFEGFQPARQLAAGDDFWVTYLVGVSGIPVYGASSHDKRLTFAFPREAEYRLQARETRVSSEVIEFTVEDPEKRRDTRLLEILRESPWLLTINGIWENYGRVEELAGEFEGSPYLGRLLVTKWRLDLRRFDDARLERLIDEISSTDLSNSAFEATRLVLLARAYDRAGDASRAKEVYGRVAREFPSTAAAAEAQRSAAGESSSR